MRNKLGFVIVALIGIASGVLLARRDALYAQESQKLTVRFENDRVRVLELRLKPGEEEGFHTHPQYVLYALTNYRVKNTTADGTAKVFERKAGDIFWGEPITHKGQNVGDTEVRALIVELKQR
jgi:quercetin dioxygenase-like cupin family protein